MPLKTIGYALTRTALNTTIRLASGTYDEVLTIDGNKGWVTLEGAGQGQTIIAGNGTDATITVYGPNSFRVRQMTIRNGMYGIYARSARVICEDVTITDNGTNGIRGRHNAVIELTRAVVQRSGAEGLRLNNGAAARVLDSEFTANGANGIIMTRGSHAEIEDSIVADNLGTGIGAYVGSSFSLGTSTIRNNRSSGLDINGSAMSSYGGNIIEGNGTAGVSFFIGSSGGIGPSDGPPDQVLANNGPGISVGHNSSLFFGRGQVSNNAMGGVTLNNSSVIMFGAGGSITNNTGYGITCSGQPGDSKKYGQPGDLSGNTSGPTNCPSP
jgi:hypothetical protein